MKKILLVALSLVTITVGCKKSSSPIPTTTNLTGLSGTYVSYKVIDTTYNNRRVEDGIETISLISIYGDTLYTNPGTSKYLVEPLIQNENPNTIFTLSFKFNSSTTGVEVGNTPIPFTYNISTGEFHDSATNTVHQNILKLNANTVEFIEYEPIGESYGQVSATYFHKL